MKLTIRLLAVLLAALMLVLALPACSDDEVSQPPSTDDEFEGFISQGTQPEQTEPTPPALPEGDKDATVNIATYAELKEKLTQYGTFVLTADITIDAEDFTPFGSYEHPFLGTLDGNGHTVTVKASSSKEELGPSAANKFIFSGIFAVTKDATIKNLTVFATVEAKTTSNYAFAVAGGIAGYMINTDVSGCIINGTVTAQSEFFNAYSGGICGIADGCEFTSCTVEATLEAKPSQNRATSGGIVGYATQETKASGCVSKSTVKATSTLGIAYAGGIAGHVTCVYFTACESDSEVFAEVTQYKASASTFGSAFAGGIVGIAGGDHADKRAEFTRCYSLKNTVSVVGNNNFAYAGGIAALINYANFTHCYSLCDVNLNTGINLAYAGAAFGVINAVGTEIDNVYTPDFSINGCIALGNVTTTHNKPQFMFYGTVFGYSFALKNTSIQKVAYASDSTFTVNGGNTLLLQGTSYPKIATAEFTLDKCVSEFGWSQDQWQTDTNGVIRAK